jgi:hypothetical protein
MTKQKSRRQFIKKAAYMAPAVLSLGAMPAIANYGSPAGTGPGTSPGTGPGSIEVGSSLED